MKLRIEDGGSRIAIFYPPYSILNTIGVAAIDLSAE
jgi:hypothetical protein